MALTGQATGDDWSVFTQGIPVDGSFCCEVHVSHGGAAGEFKHQFRHSKIFAREWEAILDGLREGVVWIGLKRAGRFICRTARNGLVAVGVRLDGVDGQRDVNSKSVARCAVECYSSV
jgi:hypothetical protein